MYPQSILWVLTLHSLHGSVGAHVDFHVAGRGKICTPLSEQGWAGITFWTLGTGTGIAQNIPKFWEREWEWKITFPNFGNWNGNDKLHYQLLGMGMRNQIPKWEWEHEWKLQSKLLGTGMSHWCSRELSGTGTGMTFKNPILFGILSLNGEGQIQFHILVKLTYFAWQI